MYVYGLIILYITYLAKKKGEQGAFINNLINAFVFIASITINIVLINIFNLPNKEFIEFPFNIIIIGFILIFLPIFYLFISREKQRLKNRKIRYVHIELPAITQFPLKYDIYRKLTHFVVLGVILLYFTSGFLNQNFVVFLVGISLIGLLTADIIRTRIIPTTTNNVS